MYPSQKNILGFNFRYPDIFSKLICCDEIFSIYTNILNLIEIYPETEHNMDNTLAHYKKLHRTKVCGQILTKNLFA